MKYQATVCATSGPTWRTSWEISCSKPHWQDQGSRPALSLSDLMSWYNSSTTFPTCTTLGVTAVRRWHRCVSVPGAGGLLLPLAWQGWWWVAAGPVLMGLCGLLCSLSAEGVCWRWVAYLAWYAPGSHIVAGKSLETGPLSKCPKVLCLVEVAELKFFKTATRGWQLKVSTAIIMLRAEIKSLLPATK